MNLIEQQNAAKDLPMQYLQQAVNGQNPNLTPWIATAELQRRTTMNQHMQPQGPQGPQPTVKDQVEQKAGLMATQAAQQAQAAQAQQGAAPPGPIPGGIPQPQPQPEEPVMAARGGLMNAPVNFKFAHGGILGFAEGDSVPDPKTFIDSMGVERDAKTGEPVKSMLQRMANWRDRQQAKAETEAPRPAPQAASNTGPNPADQMGYTQATTIDPAAQMGYTNAQQPPVTAKTPNPLAAAAAQAKPLGGPRRAPTPPGPAVEQPASTAQPAAMDPAEQASQTYATAPVKQLSLQDAIGEEKNLASAYGLDKPMGVEQRQAMDERKAAYNEYKGRAADRDFANYAAGLVGVPGSGGARYEQSRDQRYKDEAEFQREQIKDLSALEAAQRAAQEKRSGTAGSSLAAGKLASAEEGKNKAQVATTLTGDRMRAVTSKYSTDEQVKSAREVALIRERAENARHGSSEHRLALQELTDREKSYDNDIKYLESERKPLMSVLGTPITPAAKLDLERIDGLITSARTAKAAVRGGGQPAPADTMAPDRAAQFKVIR